MNIYKILPDYERFLAFDLPMKDVLMSLGKDIPLKQLMHFYKYDLQLTKNWKDIKAKFTPIEGVTKGSAIPDVTTWAPGTLVFSQKAVNLLPWLCDVGELLPVTTDAGTFHILNCKFVAQADESLSSRIVENGQVLEVKNIAFDFASVQKKKIFKTDYDQFRNLFCLDSLKAEIEWAELSGLLFSENLAGMFD